MNELANFAFEVVTGIAPDETQRAALESINDPAELRRKLILENCFAKVAQDFRLAQEITELEKARQKRILRLVVGAATTKFDGWISTNERTFNLLRPEMWQLWID